LFIRDRCSGLQRLRGDGSCPLATFAVEVHRENDSTEAAKIDRAEKRADYIAAVTQLLGDVDAVSECVGRASTSKAHPLQPQAFFDGANLLHQACHFGL
jgi:hypothetical protein